jgi:NitT/TauT family transport system substrate-binding protein
MDVLAMKCTMGAYRKILPALLSIFSIGLVALSVSIARAEEPLAKVIVGDTASFAHLGMYTAIQKGIFRKHGIEVERVAMPGGAKVLGALLTGDIDIGFLAASTTLQAQFQARPVKIIGISHAMEIYSLLARNDLKGTVTKAADLKDRTIGISSIGSGSWAFANLVAHIGSLDATRDIKIVPLGTMMSIIAGLKTNRVDAVTLWDPGTTIALNENLGYSVIDLVDPAQHRQIMHSDQSMVEVIAAKEDMISGQRDKLRKFFAALNEANAWIHSASVEEVAQAVGPLVGESNMGILVLSLKRALPGVPKIAVVDEKTFDATMTEMVETGLFKEKMAFARAVDNSLSDSR